MFPLIGMPEGAEWLVILVIVILVFGAAKLPDLARGTGQALRIFKAETKGLRDDEKKDEKPTLTAEQIEPSQIERNVDAQQAELARERIAAAGVSGLVSVELCDYRDVQGQYDAVVSVEMIEAVGEQYWPTYFAKIDEVLVPGGRVAVQAILLEHDAASDELHAIGTLGGEMFNAFFAKYEFRLALDYGSDKARRRVASRTVVMELERFCKQQVRC